MPKTNRSAMKYNYIVQALSTGPKTHRELHVHVSAAMAWNHAIKVTPQDVRSRTAELVQRGQVRYNGTTRRNGRKVYLFGLV